MIQSDYVLCVRGAGNFSMRLYETLCMGRIPLLIDSDSVSPFDDALSWGKFSLKVPYNGINSLGRHVIEFHQALSDADFDALQRDYRQVWLANLSPHGFFRTLSEFHLQRQTC